MDYQVVAVWGSATVLQGRASGVLAYEVARHMVHDNFAWPARIAPRLDEVLGLGVGEQLSYAAADDTGSARVTITRVD